jgi:hypothetical protein
LIPIGTGAFFCKIGKIPSIPLKFLFFGGIGGKARRKETTGKTKA